MRTRSKLELQFQRTISILFRNHGWLVYCHPDARKSAPFSSPGFFDLVMVKEGHLLFVECKLPGQNLRKTQCDWHEAVSYNPNVEVYIWYPADWPFIETRAKEEQPNATG